MACHVDPLTLPECQQGARAPARTGTRPQGGQGSRSPRGAPFNTRLFEPAIIADCDGQERRVVGDGEGEQAVTGARRLAARRGQSQFRTEHLLFCLATDPGSSARRVLDDLDIHTARIKKELEWIAPVQRRHRRIGRAKGTDRACSFCGRKDLGPLVAGPGVWIWGTALRRPWRSCAPNPAACVPDDEQSSERDRRSPLF
jgi:hypothetical protein